LTAKQPASAFQRTRRADRLLNDLR